MKSLKRSHLQRRFEKYDLDDWTYRDKEEDFEVKLVTNEKGQCLFAKTDFLKNDFLLFYRGKRLTKEGYFETMKEDRNEYVFAITTENIFMDGSDERSGLARFINDCGTANPIRKQSSTLTKKRRATHKNSM